MRRGVVWLMGMLCLVAGAGSGWAHPMHETRELTYEELLNEMMHNRAMAAYVARNGTPDVAERRFLSSRPPWDDHEVALYYLDTRTEIAFARAVILGNPDIHVERYERGLTDEELAALATRTKVRQVGTARGPVARAEAAALRAEAAANRVEAAVVSVEQAADRAEAIVAKLERGFTRALRK
jgi:hypothetical protein